jgi:hypothetical protein
VFAHRAQVHLGYVLQAEVAEIKTVEGGHSAMRL